MQLVNFMEEAARRVLEEMLEANGENGSLSDGTKLDILAYALNRLPSKYVVTQKGHLYTRVNELQQQFRTDLVVELTKAITFVKAHPR
jgi:competence protein ComFB